MGERVIEPSEILIDQQGLPKEDTTRVNPWIRFLARFFDYALFFFLLWAVRVPQARFEHFIPFEFFTWIPIEALLLCTWGSTPGKFFLKIEMKQGRKIRLDFVTAVKRSFYVWFRGLGMGIPIINFFCLMVAYHRLRMLHKTSWDFEENIVVRHRPVGQWRLIVAALGSASGLLFYYTQR